MKEFSEEELYNMSDEELTKAFKEAKASDTNEEEVSEDNNTDIEETLPNEVSIETSTEEAVIDNNNAEIEANSEETVENNDNSLEQPNNIQDSESSSDNKEEAETEKVSETTEEGSKEKTEDKATAEVEEKTETDETKPENEEIKEPQKFKFKAAGQDFEFTEKEMLDQFGTLLGQAVDYTKKMQTIKPHRKIIDAVQTAGLSYDDVNLMIDVFKGNKDALTQVVKKTGVGIDKDTNTVDIDLEKSNYVPTDYGRSDAELNVKEVNDSIKNDTEYPITYDVLQNQWDSESRDILFKHPKVISDFHEHVKSGLYDKIAPLANKSAILDGKRKPMVDYYFDATNAYFSEQKQLQDMEFEKKVAETNQLAKEQEAKKIAEVKASQEKQKAIKASAVRKKAAAPNKTKTVSSNKVTDYLNASDEDFNAWYQNYLDNR